VGGYRKGLARITKKSDQVSEVKDIKCDKVLSGMTVGRGPDI